MTHKYQWAEDLVQDMVPEFGDSVTIEVPENTVTGQQDPAVFNKYQSPAMILEDLKGRDDRYKRTDRGELLLPTTIHRPPKPGDLITLPNGKRYIIEMVSYLKPAGVNVAYKVFLSDG